MSFSDGKPHTEEQFGALYPNGSIEWHVPGQYFQSLDTPEGRAKFQRDYEDRFQYLYVAEIPKVRFVSRTVSISYTPPTEIS